METYYEDFTYIVQKLNLTTLLTHAEERKNQTPGSKQFQSERITKYFSLLDKDVRQRLYQLYRIDFEMFGFDAISYLWPFRYNIYPHTHIYIYISQTTFRLLGNGYSSFHGQNKEPHFSKFTMYYSCRDRSYPEGKNVERVHRDGSVAWHASWWGRSSLRSMDSPSPLLTGCHKQGPCIFMIFVKWPCGSEGNKITSKVAATPCFIGI